MKTNTPWPHNFRTLGLLEVTENCEIWSDSAQFSGVQDRFLKANALYLLYCLCKIALRKNFTRILRFTNIIGTLGFRIDNKNANNPYMISWTMVCRIVSLLKTNKLWLTFLFVFYSSHNLFFCILKTKLLVSKSRLQSIFLNYRVAFLRETIICLPLVCD